MMVFAEKQLCTSLMTAYYAAMIGKASEPFFPELLVLVEKAAETLDVQRFSKP
jgi:hypothetical protein